LLSPDERSEEPPAENEDSVLDFEDIDTLPAQDLDRITAWMEGLLANLCQLDNLQVSVCAHVCLVACHVYQCRLPVLSTNAVYLCWLPVLLTCAVDLCCLQLCLPVLYTIALHLKDIIAYVVHLFPCTSTVAHRAAITNMMLRLCNTDAPLCLSYSQFMPVAAYEITTQS